MYILGVNHGWHDSAAVLLQNGVVHTMIESDRVTRLKHAMGAGPSTAIYACLRAGGLQPSDLSAVAVGWDEPACLAQKGELYDAETFLETLFPSDLFPDRHQLPPVQFVPHHLSHAASALWTSGFDSAVVLVIDGRGDVESTSLGVGDQRSITWHRQWDISHSLGNFYGYAAEWAGFSFWGAGKLMGLAPYGQASAHRLLKSEPGDFVFGEHPPKSASVLVHESWHKDLLWRYFEELYPYSVGQTADIMAHAGFASTIQGQLEDTVLALVRQARETLNLPRLVIAGGVGLNCTLNGKILHSGIFDEVYIPPVTYDTGVSLGAALVVDRSMRSEPVEVQRWDHAYHGVAVSSEDVAQAAQAAGLPAEVLEPAELRRRTVDVIAEGGVVGWFQGRAEVGQRALGARSLVADPRRRDQLVKVNDVKGRETWRPLAPSVLEEYAGDFFDGGLPRLADFMLAALPVRAAARRTVPATVHVDGSARPQRVRRATNESYWSLIEEFRQRTGVPVLMNTSFNLAGEPIVHSAADAIRSFIGSRIDALVIGNHFMARP